MAKITPFGQPANEGETDHQDALKTIEQECDKEIAQDRENQIKRLFQQLPHSQRINLYHQLEKYLSAPTEELDG